MQPGSNGWPEQEHERDAFRVQVAAVAAQQASLLLEEEKLRQRSSALERQEAQLAAHFDERRKRLDSLQEQLRRERDALRSERAAADSEAERRRAELEQRQGELTAAGEAVRKQRERLAALHKRLRRRSQRQRAQLEADYARRDRDVAARRAGLADESDALSKERAALLQARLRFNTEAELGRRQLQEAWKELALSQHEWDACLNVEHAARARRAAELAAREAALAAAEKALHERERLWLRKQAELEREVDGLENRVRHQREKLVALQSPETEPLPSVAAPAVRGPDARAAAPASVDLVSADLADQRKHLLEQWDRLLVVKADWEREREALLAGIETAAARLDEREHRLRQEAAAAEAQALVVAGRLERAERAQAIAEGWRCRLAAGQAALENERSALLAELRAREESTAAEGERLEALRRRWTERWRSDTEQLRGERNRCEEARAAYLALLGDCESRRAQLEEGLTDLAAQALALEQLRIEVSSRAADAAAAERRLAKLEQRNRSRLQGEEGALRRVRREVGAEVKRVQDEWRRLKAAEEAVRTGRNELDRLRDEWESMRSAQGAAAARLQEELDRLRSGAERERRELLALREELERVACRLIEGGGEAEPPAERRAA